MKDLCLPYREGTVYGKHIARRKRSIIGKSLRFFSTLRVGPLDGRKARRLRGPGFAQNRKRLFPKFSLWGKDS